MIDRTISEYYGVPVECLQNMVVPQGRPKQPRWSWPPGGAGQTLRAIGQHYGGISGQAVTMMRSRARENRRVDWCLLEQALDRQVK